MYLLQLTGSLDTSTDWQMSGALTSKCLSQLLTSSLVLRGQTENSLGFDRQKQGSKSKHVAASTAVSNVLPLMSTLYHNVDFSLPLLDDEGASHCQTFIGVTTFKRRPQGCHQTVASCSPLGPNLYDLQRHTGREPALLV